MNYTTAVFLINPALRALKVSYLPRPDKNDEFADFTESAFDKKHVKTYKTLDPNIKEGDFVVVPTETRHGMTVGKVIEVDVPVDYDSPIEMKWVIDRVNHKKYEKIVTDEAEYIKKMRMSEEEAKKKELRDKMQAFSDGQLSAMAIASTSIAIEIE